MVNSFTGRTETYLGKQIKAAMRCDLAVAAMRCDLAVAAVRCDLSIVLMDVYPLIMTVDPCHGPLLPSMSRLALRTCLHTSCRCVPLIWRYSALPPLPR